MLITSLDRRSNSDAFVTDRIPIELLLEQKTEGFPHLKWPAAGGKNKKCTADLNEQQQHHHFPCWLVLLLMLRACGHSCNDRRSFALIIKSVPGSDYSWQLWYCLTRRKCDNDGKRAHDEERGLTAVVTQFYQKPIWRLWEWWTCLSFDCFKLTVGEICIIG